MKQKIYEEEHINGDKSFLIYDKPDYRVISAQEYEHLKRLDDNVKKKIEVCKQHIQANDSNASFAKICIELLESSYK